LKFKAMKTLAELKALDDEAFAQGVFDGFSSETPLEQDMGFAEIFQMFIRFLSYVGCDGFESIYYQIVFPPRWPDYERLLEKIGARRFASVLRRGRQLYFGGDYLPGTSKEWSGFRSPVWEKPESDAGKEFARIAEEGMEAYGSDGVIRKFGAYMRAHWDELYKPKAGLK
jgi:hypothetical protein